MNYPIKFNYGIRWTLSTELRILKNYLNFKILCQNFNNPFIFEKNNLQDNDLINR